MYLYRSVIDVIIVALWFEPVFSGTEFSPTGHSLGKVGRFRLVEAQFTIESLTIFL